MGRLQLFAIGIDELRDMFGASAELAARLRTVAAARFPNPLSPTSTKPGWATWLSSRFHRSIDPPYKPTGLTPTDIENLLGARYVAPDRLASAWQVVAVWASELSWGELDQRYSAAQLMRLDFDLARAGLPSQFAIGRLIEGEAQLPLGKLPGLRVGYSKNAHVQSTRAALTTVIGEVDTASKPGASVLLTWLNNYPEWTRQALAENRPAPDLAGIWWPDS